jgi:putative DNA primase/helicase
MNHTITPELIRAALTHLPANLPRDDWARIGMAIKSEYPDDTGFALFDQWSSTADSYSVASTKSTWKSLKASGGVTVGTLLHEAQQNGHVMGESLPPLHAPSPEQIKQQAQQRAATAQRDRAATSAQHTACAAQALERWDNASDNPPPGTDSTAQGSNSAIRSLGAPYLALKGVQGYGVRYEPSGAVLVPLCDAAGTLWNVQAILPTKPTHGSDKLFMKGGRKSGLWHLLGVAATDKAQAATILIAEGYATAASLHQATGYPVACAFDAGNLKSVAVNLRAAYPGATLVLCGDDDADTQASTGRNPGKEKATAAAQAVKGVAVFPAGLLAGESDFNDSHARAGLEVVRAQVQAAIDAQALQTPAPVSGDVVAPIAGGVQSDAHHSDAPGQDGEPHTDNDPFQVRDNGVWFCGRDFEGKPKPPMWLCSRLDVSAGTRDFEGNGFGYLLEFKDPLHHAKQWPMPARMLSGDGNEYRAALLNLGLRIQTGSAAKARLTEYIQSRKPQAWARCTDRTGWHTAESGAKVYVLPKQTIGSAEGERVIYQSDSAMENTFRSTGTLEHWRSKVAALCVGNSRLAFSVSCAFAGVLLRWVGGESGGFHFRGDSSSGKTTALRVAASVFGGQNYMQRWRATDNAIESIAAQHCDALLVLDELAQIDPKQAGEVAYMLGNGQSKARAARTALPKPRLSWTLLFLSAGEIGLAQHMAEGGKRARAGQELRMCDIPADAGAGLGAFETLHGIESGAAFSDVATRAAARHYGSAGVAFIQHVIEMQDGIGNRTKQAIDVIAGAWIPQASSGQVHRVGRRFALVAAAGELATTAGLTDWPAGEATRAAKACFDAWLSARGGNGNAEEYTMLAQVRSFIQLHGAGRFTWWHRAGDDHAPNTLSRAGYRRMVTPEGKAIKANADHQREYGERISDGDAEQTAVEYFVFPEVFDKELCQGFDPMAVKRLLRDKGHLEPATGGHLARRERLPGMGNTMVIKLKASILDVTE